MSALLAPAPARRSKRPATFELGPIPNFDVAPLMLELPTPPSVNDCFGQHGKQKGKRGRHETRRYRDWKGHAEWRLRSQQVHRFDCPVVVFGAVDRMNASADIDNRIKPTLDILKRVGVYGDDRQVTGVAFVWAPSRNAMTRLLIVPATELHALFHPATAHGATGGWFLEAPSQQEDAA